jgi:hypothetical protein
VRVTSTHVRLRPPENIPENGPNSVKFVPERLPMGVETKAAVTVAEMSRMVGLSRARFYQLIGSAFPYPIYNVSTRRPFYDEEAQQTCLQVRQRNCGIDGKPILFYCRRSPISMPIRKRTVQVAKPKGNSDLLDGLRSLGLAVVPTQVDGAVKTLFPKGIDGVDPGQVVRSIFIHLKKNGG